MKRTAILLVAAAIGAWLMRDKYGTTTSVAVIRSAPRVEVASVAMPPVIESFPTAGRFTPQRDVFAFRSVSVEDKRSRLSPSPPPEGQARVPVHHKDEETVVVAPPQPPAYRYLGSFGPQETPILVYKGNGDVVNVPLRKP
jgi:hypothetical protein